MRPTSASISSTRRRPEPLAAMTNGVVTLTLLGRLAGAVVLRGDPRVGVRQPAGRPPRATSRRARAWRRGRRPR
jgi:hypothetical protein